MKNLLLSLLVLVCFFGCQPAEFEVPQYMRPVQILLEEGNLNLEVKKNPLANTFIVEAGSDPLENFTITIWDSEGETKYTGQAFLYENHGPGEIVVEQLQLGKIFHVVVDKNNNISYGGEKFSELTLAAYEWPEQGETCGATDYDALVRIGGPVHLADASQFEIYTNFELNDANDPDGDTLYYRGSNLFEDSPGNHLLSEGDPIQLNGNNIFVTHLGDYKYTAEWGGSIE